VRLAEFRLQVIDPLPASTTAPHPVPGRHEFRNQRPPQAPRATRQHNHPLIATHLSQTTASVFLRKPHASRQCPCSEAFPCPPTSAETPLFPVASTATISKPLILALSAGCGRSSVG